jgi:hypothetical protein
MSDLKDLWLAVAAELPQGWELGGVTYHGPDHDGPWVAFLFWVERMETGGPEGIGLTAEQALENLRTELRSWVPEEASGT